MQSIKPGRGPSAMGGLGGIVAVIFGIFWTIMAFKITRGSPFPLIGIVFPLFGLLFVVLGVVGVIYNLRNAIARDRFSIVDITSHEEEPDPLNQLLAPKTLLEPSLPTEAKLEKLLELHRKGLISDAEHATQRQRILDRI